MSFIRATGQKPERIIFYRCCPDLLHSNSSFYSYIYILSVLSLCRDGVSEGQFYQVLLYELDAIRKVWW